MKTKIFFIEDKNLPEIVADQFLNYPGLKIFDNKGYLVFDYNIIKHKNIRYIIHNLNAKLDQFLNEITSNCFNIEL